MTDKEKNDSLKNQDKNFNENFTQEKEQIMIDGIDVSKCEFILDGIGIICNLKNGRTNRCNCSDYPDCYFKQLVRKTQECEELKESVDKIKNYVKNQMFDVDCKNWFDRFIYTFEDWKKSICEANDRYRKALEEIEEIVNKKTETSICSECAYNHIPECKDNCMQDVLENILDIINKTKDGEND